MKNSLLIIFLLLSYNIIVVARDYDVSGNVKEYVVNDIQKCDTPEIINNRQKATIYYVSPTGNDDNTGTSLALPFASIGKASEMVKPGDKVLVRSGKYKISQSININCSGTKEQPITFMPYKQELPVFDFSALKGEGRINAIRFTQGAQYVIFERFDLGNGTTGIGISLCHNITVRDCKIHDFEYVGLGVGADDCLIENNEFYRICMAYVNCNNLTGGWPQVVNTSSKRPVPPALVSSHAMNNIFRGNYIHDCWGEGIDPMFSDGVLVENNVIRDVFSVGIYMDGTRNAVIRNNYIYTTDNTRMRNDSKALLSGILMGSEYFGGWSSYPAISHVENIYIYNNVLSRVGTGIGHWKDNNNTDYKNIYENVKIYNNTIDTYEGNGFGIKFATNLDYPAKGNECKNNIFRCSQNISAEKGFVFENNLWVNGIPGTGNHVNSLTGDPGWVNPVPGGDVEGYKISKKSISVGKAQSIKGLITDKTGKTRNGLTALGAFEADVKVKGTPGLSTSAVDNMIVPSAPDYPIGVNLSLNSQFDEVQNNTPLEWNVSGDKDAFTLFSPGHIIRNRSNQSPEEKTNPEYCVKLGKQEIFNVYTFQTLKNIPNGRYGLHVRVKRFGTGGNFYAETKDFGGERIICNFPLANTMNEWSDYSKSFFQLNMSDIEVVSGKCTISFYGSGGSDDYVLIDDVCFYRY